MSLDVNISEPDEFNCVELHTIINEVAKLINLHDFSYHVDFISGNGDNYVANLFRVIVKDTNENNNESIRVIVKTLINTTRQELFHELHKREVYVYNDVMPKFQKASEKFYKDKKFNLAKCYTSCADLGKEVIIFEDLSEKGFEMDQNKFQSIDYEHATLVFKTLAKFHALSIILEKEDSVGYNAIIANCKDIIFNNNFLNKSKLSNYFNDSLNNSINLITDKQNKEHLIEKLTPNLIERMQRYLQPRKRNVLCHGDFWINNILFKNEEGKPVDAIFLDFQAMRYASPLTDIMYFTYLCTDVDFRKRHLEDLLNIYYHTLTHVLSTCDIDINIAYPRNDFENDKNEFLNYGLICALLELKMMTVATEDDIYIKDINNRQEIKSIPAELKLYALRVNELIEEFADNGNLYKL